MGSSDVPGLPEAPRTAQRTAPKCLTNQIPFVDGGVLFVVGMNAGLRHLAGSTPSSPPPPDYSESASSGVSPDGKYAMLLAASFVLGFAWCATCCLCIRCLHCYEAFKRRYRGLCILVTVLVCGVCQHVWFFVVAPAAYRYDAPGAESTGAAGDVVGILFAGVRGAVFRKGVVARWRFTPDERRPPAPVWAGSTAAAATTSTMTAAELEMIVDGEPVPTGLPVCVSSAASSPVVLGTQAALGAGAAGGTGALLSRQGSAASDDALLAASAPSVAISRERGTAEEFA